MPQHQWRPRAVKGIDTYRAVQSTRLSRPWCARKSCRTTQRREQQRSSPSPSQARPPWRRGPYVEFEGYICLFSAQWLARVHCPSVAAFHCEHFVFTTSCWFLLSVLPVKDIDIILDVIVNLFFIAVEIPISTVLYRFVHILFIAAGPGCCPCHECADCACTGAHA